MLLESSPGASPASFLSLLTTSDQADATFYEAAPDLEESLTKCLEDPASAKPKRKNAESTPKKAKTSAHQGLYAYYSRISKFAPLSRDEEEKIFLEYAKVKARVKKFETGVVDGFELVRCSAAQTELRNRITEHYLRFVVRLAKSFWMDKNPENFENLVSAGNIGLIRAVDKFDVKRGTRFLSYAAHWIALEIRTEIANSTLVKVPIWYQKTMKRLADAYNELARLNDTVTPHALARRAKVPVKLISKLSDNSPKITHDHIPPTKPEVPFCEITHSVTPGNSVEDEYFQKHASLLVNTMIDQIIAKEKQDAAPLKARRLTEGDAIRSVFGLNEAGPQNLRQVSNVTNICSERVRQLKEKGLVTLRKKMLGRGITSTGDLI